MTRFAQTVLDDLHGSYHDLENLEKEVDDILRKIARSGEASLTEKERDTLRYASQEYQKRSGNKR